MSAKDQLWVAQSESSVVDHIEDFVYSIVNYY